MKQRKLVIGLLVMLAVLASGFTYAFWAGSVGAPATGTDSVTVVIGQGTDVTTSFDLGKVVNNGVLVPAAYAGAGQVGLVTIGFDVAWDVLALGNNSLTGSTTTGTLNYGYTVKLYTDASLDTEITDVDAKALVLVSLLPGTTGITLGGANVPLSFVVTLGEPGSFALYNIIKNARIVIDFTFTVTGIATT